MSGYRYFLIASITLIFAGCTDEPVPLWTVNNCGKEIVAADDYDNATKLIVLTSRIMCSVDTQNGVIVRQLSHKLQNVHDVACGPGRCWIGGGLHENGSLAAFDIDTTSMKVTVVNTEIAQINSIAVSSNRQVVTAQSDESLALYDWNGSVLAKVFVPDGLEINAATFSGEGIIAGNDRGELIAWDGKSVTIQKRVHLGKGAIMALAVKHGKMLVGGWEYLSVINASNWLDKKDFSFNKVATMACDTQDESTVWCGLSDGSIARINLDDSNINVLRVHKGAVRFVEAKGMVLLTASEDGVVSAWKIADISGER